MVWREVRGYVESIAVALALYGVARLAGIDPPEWVQPYALAFFAVAVVAMCTVAVLLPRRRS